MIIQLPQYANDMFEPYRYKILAGGRGSGKSVTVARILLIEGKQRKIRCLCAREFQNSINESVLKLLEEESEKLKFNDFYKSTNNSFYGANGSEFIFKGVRFNVNSIKSMQSLTHLWIEEAHTTSQHSLDILIPTIREPNSQIYMTFNPEHEDDPVYKMFFNKSGEPIQREDALIKFVNYDENPWFPDVLKAEKDHLYNVNPELAAHVWGGQVRTNSHSQIFRNKFSVREFEPLAHFEGPYFGVDWGFSQDPTFLVKVYLDRQNREILIRKTAIGYGIELDYLADLFDRVPDSRKYKIRADCSRPETISFLKRKGFQIEGAEKWSGSVQDGIEWLKTWNSIVLHPETEMKIQKDRQFVQYGLVTEFKNYSFKTDRLTGDILPDIVDAYNHGIDAIRYACQPMIKNKVSTFDSYK